MKHICCQCGKEKECIRIKEYFDYARGNNWIYYCVDCYKKIKEDK